MKVAFSKAFDKQTSRIKDKTLLKRVGTIIKKVMDCNSLSEVTNIKPITGYPGYYRIRLGTYRIGISMEKDTVWFHFFGKRDESTYKKFP
jgi:mRNA interferase RelE/StbE